MRANGLLEITDGLSNNTVQKMTTTSHKTAQYLLRILLTIGLSLAVSLVIIEGVFLATNVVNSFATATITAATTLMISCFVSTRMTLNEKVSA